MPLLYGLSWGSWTDLGGGTNHSPSACASIPGHDAAVAITGTNGSVYTNFHTDGGGFGGWTQVPPKRTDGTSFTTEIAPCAGMIDGKLCLFAVADDNTVHYNLLSGSNWSNWTAASGVAETATLIGTDRNGAIYLVGMHREVWVNPKPTSGGAWALVPGTLNNETFLSGSAVCAASFTLGSKSNQIGLFCKGNTDDTEYYLLSEFGPIWYPMEGTTSHTMAAAPQAPSSDAGSWLFLVGGNDYIYVASLSAPTSGPGWSRLGVTGEDLQTDAAPAAAAPLYKSGGGTSQKVFLFAKKSGASNIWVNIADVSFESFE